MTTFQSISFSAFDMGNELAGLAISDMDQLDFGVIGFDAGNIVQVFNRFEAQASGLAPQRVLGLPLFTVVAPCMNNFLVAQRFEDAAAQETELDMTLDYVLTLRMRPIQVALRLLAAPHRELSYVLIERAL